MPEWLVLSDRMWRLICVCAFVVIAIVVYATFEYLRRFNATSIQSHNGQYHLKPSVENISEIIMAFVIPVFLSFMLAVMPIVSGKCKNQPPTIDGFGVYVLAAVVLVAWLWFLWEIYKLFLISYSFDKDGLTISNRLTGKEKRFLWTQLSTLGFSLFKGQYVQFDNEKISMPKKYNGLWQLWNCINLKITNLTNERIKYNSQLAKRLLNQNILIIVEKLDDDYNNIDHVCYIGRVREINESYILLVMYEGTLIRISGNLYGVDDYTDNDEDEISIVYGAAVSYKTAPLQPEYVVRRYYQNDFPIEFLDKTES